MIKVDELAERIKKAALGQSNERIFCIVGPNGSGKSRLLEQLRELLIDPEDKKHQVFPPAKADQVRSLILPAARALLAPFNNLMKTGDIIQDYPDPLTLISSAQQRSAGYPTMSMFYERGAIQLLQSIQSQDNINLSKFRQELFEWAEKENCHLIPKPQKPTSAKFPILELLSNVSNRNIVSKEDFSGEILTHDLFGIQLKDKVISLDKMSDGEKQSFLLAVFLINSNVGKFAFLVDEPELHLNESRAEEIWGSIETHLTHSVFFYATHSMSFATRDNIDLLLTIDMDGVIEIIEDNAMLPANLAREMVGARVKILRTRRPVVFCEDSLAKSFLEDVMQNYDIDVIKLTGRAAVVASTSNQPSWGHIFSTPLVMCGVIDRDEMSDEDVIAIEKRNTIVLPFNEIESFLVQRDLLLTWVRRMNPENENVDAGYSLAIENATRSLARTAISKHGRRLSHQWSLDVTVDHTPDQVIKVSLGAAETLETNIRNRANAILAARKTGDWDAIIEMYPGKELYQSLYDQSQSRFGVSLQRDPAAQYRMIRNDPTIFDVAMNLPQVVGLRDKIIEKLKL